MEKIRYAIKFIGHVQGVGFRYTAYHLAQKYSLTGWVRNEYDGTVSSEVQGTEAAIDQWLTEIFTGRYISVDRVLKATLPLNDEERTFSVVY
ncbi:MAG: acylphosphatase [Lachnospiraceae bacterium]|nr:acylphosphatase [Lachnospiraceae bacterium]